VGGRGEDEEMVVENTKDAAKTVVVEEEDIKEVD